jgi:DNA-3-methyladenine glycosylase II
MQQVDGTFRPVPPFDFRKSLEFINQFRPAMGQHSMKAGVLTKALHHNGQVIIFRVHSTGTLEAPEMAYSLYSENVLDEPTHAAVRGSIARYLSLDDDLRPFYALAQADPAFWPIAQAQYGYHQVRFLTPFESVCWALLSQRNPMTASIAMKDRLMANYGNRLTMDGIEYAAFPDAAQLAQLNMDQMNAMIGNHWKTEWLRAAATAFAAVDEVWLREAPFGEVEAWLLKVSGIVAWSASFILLYGLGRMEKLPFDEKWLLEAVRRVYAQDGLTVKQVAQIALPYGEYQGYWAHYLRVVG